MIDLDSQYLRWFDTWLKNKSVGLARTPKVRYFVMGENKWRQSSEWPPKESKPETRYFQFGKVNAGARSTASLVKVMTKDSVAKSDYDPSKESIGIDTTGVGDQGQDLFTKDSTLPKSVMVLRTEKFGKDRMITGPVTVEFDF
jgi:hypothetical protein